MYGRATAKAKSYEKLVLTIQDVQSRMLSTGSEIFDVMTNLGKASCWDGGIRDFVGQTLTFNTYSTEYKGNKQITIDLKYPPTAAPAPATTTAPAASGKPAVSFEAKEASKQRAMYMSYAKDVVIAMMNNKLLDADANVVQLILDIYKDMFNAAEENIEIARTDTAKSKPVGEEEVPF